MRVVDSIRRRYSVQGRHTVLYLVDGSSGRDLVYLHKAGIKPGWIKCINNECHLEHTDPDYNMVYL